MKYYGNTHIGEVRTENQDNFQIIELGDAVCLTVCDGMGGVSGGRMASTLALEGYHEYLSQYASEIEFNPEKYDALINIVKNAVENAQRKIVDKINEDSSLDGMGTTLVSAFVRDGKAFVVNVGDSRCYRLLNGEIKKVTKDHSFVQQLVDSGVLTEEEAENHPNKNCITRAVGANYDITPDIFYVEAFDQIILCSDGLTNMVSINEIKNMLLETESPQIVVETLITLARQNGGYDNITVALIKEEE